MKKKNLLLGFIFSILIVNLSLAQVYTEPAFPTVDDNITVYYDATQGTAGLKDCGCDIYVHTGLITSASSGLSDWKYVKTQWGQANAAWKMTALGNNLYSWTVNIKQFYAPAQTETIQKIAFVFRNAAGSAEGKATGGKDIFTDIYDANAPFAAKLLSPANGAQLLKSNGETIEIKGAASKTADLTISDNGTVLKQISADKNINYTITVNDANSHTITFTAKNGTDEVTQSFTYTGVKQVEVQDPPASAKLGATYNGNGSVTFMLYAPGKKNIYLVGDFNNYDLNPDYLLKRSVDGNRWWITIDNWTTGTHTYQYAVDGTLRVADPHSELVLDPNNDKYIPTESFPNVPAYPAKASGYVSVLEYPKKKMTWAIFNRPAKTDLVIYELLVRDFSNKRNFQYVLDSLNYLQRLGINAIEFMPVNEFDGNLSWGYNPTFHSALDKYYGSPDKFKELINECHKRGIAVILDVVFNHVSEKSPLIQMYPPSTDTYVNATAKHDFNVFLDFNHESAATRAYVDRCLEQWLLDYNVDGFRFDLSKGFTQKNTLGNTAAWGQYDASRIAILKHYNDGLKAVGGGDTYTILEHFAEDKEEQELSKNGMMLWGNFNYDFTEGALGYSNGSFTRSFYPKKGFTEPNLVVYTESHDEERLMYKALQFGNSNGSYTIKDLPTGLRRSELSSVFMYCIPGPKMMWQFEEMGYDYSINTCQNGSVNNACRLDIKPTRWDYLQDADRKRLFEIVSSLISIKKQYNVFQSSDVTIYGGGTNRAIYSVGSDMDLAVLGNFGVKQSNIPTDFTKLGKWYEYFSGDSLNVTNTDMALDLRPGEYRVYTTKKLPKPIGGYKTYHLTDDRDIDTTFDFNIFPNPSTSDKVTINYVLTKPTVVHLEIFDILGRKVSEPLYETQDSGSYGNTINKLEPGTYIAKLGLNKRSIVKKFVVLR